MPEKTLAHNKKAFHDFQILEEFEVGIKLLGPEVKSMKASSVSLKESFIKIEKGEIWIKNMHISPYKFARQEEIDPMRNRKLLANKKEINKLTVATQKNGLTIIPLKIKLKNNLVKLDIAIAKGKKKWDKRESIKKKEIKRELKKGF